MADDYFRAMAAIEEKQPVFISSVEQDTLGDSSSSTENIERGLLALLNVLEAGAPPERRHGAATELRERILALLEEAERVSHRLYRLLTSECCESPRAASEAELRWLAL